MGDKQVRTETTNSQKTKIMIKLSAKVIPSIENMKMESPRNNGPWPHHRPCAQAEDMDEKTHEGYTEKKTGGAIDKKTKRSSQSDILIKLPPAKVSPSPAKIRKRKGKDSTAVATESKAPVSPFAQEKQGYAPKEEAKEEH